MQDQQQFMGNYHEGPSQIEEESGVRISILLNLITITGDRKAGMAEKGVSQTKPLIQSHPPLTETHAWVATEHLNPKLALSDILGPIYKAIMEVNRSPLPVIANDQVFDIIKHFSPNSLIHKFS